MADDKKHAEIDAALVRQLAEILNETDLTEVEVERGELRIRVAREITAAPQSRRLLQRFVRLARTRRGH